MKFNKEKNFMSAVVYVHNAQERIEEFLKTIMNVLEKNFEHSEIICVNDYSDDKSVDVIKSVSESATTTSISVLNLSHFHGLEMAMNAGVDLTIGDFVYEFDSTIMDYEEEEIMKIYRKSLQGYDVVSSSPDKQRNSSNLFYYIFDKFSGTKDKLTTERFRILSRRVINRISSMNKTTPYRKLMYATCGYKTEKNVYKVKDINKVSDKLEKKYRKGLAVDSLILFTNVGFRFSMTMTLAMMAFTLFMTIYSVATFILSTPVEGWTTTILFLSVAFFGLFGILSIVIKYLQLIVEMVFKRKQYNFESIEKLTK